MSVTFSVYKPGSFDEGMGENFLSPKGWVATFEDDPQYGKIQTNQNPWEMNIANVNFCRLMELMGLDTTDSYGGQWGDGSLQHVHRIITFLLDGIKGMPELDGGTPHRAGRQYDHVWSP